MPFVNCLIRYGVIAGLAGGAVLLIAGPDRVFALAGQARSSIQSKIDQNISDPVALRAQLKSLASQYPERIADVRGDLAELQAQKGQLQRELAISRRVVELAENDLSQLAGLLTRAGEAQAQAVSMGGLVPTVRIVLANESFDLEQAQVKAVNIEQTRQVYASRAADTERDLGYISQQEQRLSELLAQLEQEHAEFETQLFALDRQVDAIARNERMIAMMEKRQRTIDEQSRYQANSLDQVQARFAEIRSRQEAQLQGLGRGAATQSYENRAKIDLDARNRVAPRPASGFGRPTIIVEPPVLEIRPESAEGARNSSVRLPAPSPVG